MPEENPRSPEPEVVIRLAEEERPRLLPALVKAGLMLPLAASAVIAQAHALKVKKDFSPGEELIKARFYLLADLAQEFKAVHVDEFKSAVEKHLREGRSIDEAVRLAEQEIESEINGKYADDQVAFDLVVLSTSKSGNRYEITIDPVFTDLKYANTPYEVGDPDYPEGGLQHLKYHTYGLGGETVQVEACHTNCDCYTCHGDCYTCGSDCHSDTVPPTDCPPPNCDWNHNCYNDTVCVTCHTNCHTDNLPPDVSHHKPPVSECPTPMCPNDIVCHSNCYGCHSDCYNDCYTDLRCYGDCYNDCYSCHGDCYGNCDCHADCHSDCHSDFTCDNCYSCHVDCDCFNAWW